MLVRTHTIYPGTYCQYTFEHNEDYFQIIKNNSTSMLFSSEDLESALIGHNFNDEYQTEFGTVVDINISNGDISGWMEFFYNKTTQEIKLTRFYLEQEEFMFNKSFECVNNLRQTSL
jgi:hypothetical protein